MNKVLGCYALFLIQQKEQESAEQAEKIRQLEAQNAELLKKVEQLQAENAQLLRDVHGKCGACKWMYADGFERVCDPCLSEIKDNFEWRGVQKEAPSC